MARREQAELPLHSGEPLACAEELDAAERAAADVDGGEEDGLSRSAPRGPRNRIRKPVEIRDYGLLDILAVKPGPLELGREGR
jgi:hypothetical protein